ncbi:MAG: Ig-like domain-containing protein [Smithella sp.]|jgi:hypothetical protein
MKRFKALQVSLVFIVLILSIYLITGCSGSGGGNGNSGTTAPVVSSVVPLNNAGSVAINTKIAVTFSEAMDQATITGTTFTVVNTTAGGTAVTGTVTSVGQNAIFTPAADLAASTLYTVTITTGAKDKAGNALASNFVWSFTTGTAEETTAPTVTLTAPADTSTSVATNTKIAATFSDAMDPLTITGTTFTVVNTTAGGTAVAGTVAYIGKTATFTPTSNLPASSLFTATITTGVTDLEGVAIASNYVWTFTTGTTTDTTAPTVTLTDPLNGAIGVALSKSVKATFSKAMDPLTITATTFTLEQGTTPVPGTVTYVGLVATFMPLSDLTVNTTYTATITTGVKDIDGNALISNQVWSFTTITALAAGPQPVDLGTAGNFVILSETGITEATPASTHITGNIGTSPITGAAITVACSEMVTGGNIYTVDAAGPACRVVDPVGLTAAISDMETAYTDAAGRTTPDFTNLYAGILDGRTLVPGLYKYTTGVTIGSTPGANVTLSGGANDVWIFQISGDLTLANGSSIMLTGGALAKNVFWQVGGPTGAILGTTSSFEGNILSAKQVTIASGAVLNGRALAQTQVTLNGNTITVPAP